eukprot:5486704-Prymnesium_polylepis.2
MHDPGGSGGSRVCVAHRRTITPGRMAQGRSVKKKRSVFTSNAVCRPEPWHFERRVTHQSAT